MSETLERPSGPYWEDPVFRHLSRRRRDVADADEGARLDALLQELIGEAMDDDAYWELAAEARADRKQRKQERRQQARPPAVAEQPSERNTSDLKKRIFNRHVSRENMIKALEALPPSERAATIAGLPPGLKRKLGSYLKA